MLATLARIALLALPAMLIAPSASAGPENVAFPAAYKYWVRYGTVDRYDTKQYRELYTSPEAVQAAKQGQPLPNGTVIVMAIYKAQLDAQGNPVKDANGRFVKGELANVAVMEKRRGWGADYPEELRNGEWEYSMFNPDGKFNEKANIKSCFECHKPHSKQDFVISFASLSGKATAAPVVAKTGANDVSIAGFTFGPAKVTVKPGEKVSWTNTDDSPHQISVTGKPLKTEVLLKGQSAALTFDEPGTYGYICSLHPAMKGTVEVVK